MSVKDKIIKWSIFILIIILPFLDMLRTTGFKDIEVFSIALIELVNIVLILTAFATTFFKIDKRKFIKIFIYFVLVLIYIVLHYNNIIKFDTNIFEKASINFLVESFYIFRVYILPLMLVFILYENKDIFNKDFYFKVFKIVISVISFSIIILNILKLSYISYSPTKDFIEANMFDYFWYKGDFKMLTSRGWFDSANEISAITFMLFPVNILMLFEERKRSNFVLLLAQALAMILLGTRTSAMGTVLISGVVLVGYFIINKINYNPVGKKLVKNFIRSFIFISILLCISPFMIAKVNEGKVDFSIKEQSAYDELNDEENIDNDAFIKLIDKYKSEYMINEAFLKLYPINNDVEFWINIARRDKALNNDSRKLKTDILERIVERNNNPNDKWFGVGYTINFMDLERDYFYQYYLFGIVGLILFILPYFGFLIGNVIKFFKDFKNNLTVKNMCSFMAPVLGLVIAYYSGHVFGWVSPMMFLAITTMFLSYVIGSDDNG